MAANRNLFFISFQVDRSIVESFVQGGRMAITSRVYPRVAVDNLANLYLFNNGTTPVTVRSVDVYHRMHYRCKVSEFLMLITYKISTPLQFSNRKSLSLMQKTKTHFNGFP
jgi:hypothetical protein